jgi:glutaredoxin
MATAKTVVLYSKQQDCAPCEAAKRFLNEHKIEYVEKDVGDRENLQELVREHRLMTVPVLVVDDTPVKGFDRVEYNQALGLS